MKRFASLVALAGALAVGSPTLAQTDHTGHDAAAAEDTAATAAYRAANDQMHTDMDIEFSGDANIDFARSMIPHHQGAIAMAQTMLAHGADPTMRALAEEIIAAQEAEIAILTDWLAAQGQ